MIFEKEGFGRDVNGELVNATVAWDFTGDEEKKLPDHVVVDKNGNAFNLASLKGKTYLVSFWATWCAPCLKTKPDLEQLKKDYAEHRGVRFIDISFDEDKKSWMKYLGKNIPAGKQLISENPAQTGRILDFAGIPKYFVVQPDGTYNIYESFEVAEKAVLEAVQ
jgi:thiol-disulfide isomerase/thioredoxin